MRNLGIRAPMVLVAGIFFSTVASSLVRGGECIVHTIVAPEASGNIGFASAVAVDGNRFIVSSRFTDGVDEDSGAVHVYQRSGARVDFLQTLTSPLAGEDDRFGAVADLEGPWLVVGAPMTDETRGVAHVYEHVGGSYELVATLSALEPQPGDEFGRAVAVRGNYIIVGAPRDDEAGPGAGAAWVFHYERGAWVPVTKLLPDPTDVGDAFGRRIVVEGDIAAIAAHLDDDAGLDAGAVYLFERTGGDWIRLAKLTAADPRPSAWFGNSLAMRDRRLLVGAENHDFSGSAHLFENVDGAWTETTVLRGSDAAMGDGFGAACAIFDDQILVTSKNDTGTDFGIGASYLFREHEGEWMEEAKFTVPSAAGGDQFGRSVAIVNKIGLVAGTFEDGRNGALFAHHLQKPDCRCMAGRVNQGEGPIRDTLFVNGSSGGANRTVFAEEGELLTAYVLEPPLGGHGKFVVHANVGRPDKDTVHVMTGGLGTSCFPILLSQSASPIAIWNSIGRIGEIGDNVYFDGSEQPEPSRAPAILFQLNDGDPVNLPSGTVVTFQGAIGDPAYVGEKEGAVTNAVVLVIR